MIRRRRRLPTLRLLALVALALPPALELGPTFWTGTPFSGSRSHRASCRHVTNSGTAISRLSSRRARGSNSKRKAIPSSVLGSAAPNEYDLVLGYYSVHTSPNALCDGEAHISVIRTRLVQEGRL